MKMLIYLLLAGEEVQFLFFELYAATRCINSFVIVDLLEPPPSGGAYVEVKTTPRIDVGQCQCKSTPDAGPDLGMGHRGHGPGASTN